MRKAQAPMSAPTGKWGCVGLQSTPHPVAKQT